MTETNALPKDQVYPMLAHVSGGLLGFFWPFLSFIGPLFIWLLKKEDPATNYHARRALNWQLTCLLLIAVMLGAALAVGMMDHRRVEAYGVFLKQPLPKGEYPAQSDVEKWVQELNRWHRLSHAVGTMAFVGIIVLAVGNLLLALFNGPRAFRSRSIWYPPSVRVMRLPPYPA